LTQAEPLKIMCLGDSRTAGSNSTNCYRPYLSQMMKTAGYSFDFVGTLTKHNSGDVPPDTITIPFDTDHDGHWGWPTHYLVWYDYQRLGAATWAREKKPDIILAMLGFADLMQETDSISVRADRTASEISAVIDSLRSVNPALAILLSNQYPANPIYVRPPLCYSIDSLNVRIPAIIEAKNTPQSPVIFVDTWTGFNSSSDIIGFGDGTHANKSGSIKVANAWLSKLWPFFDSIPPVSVNSLNMPRAVLPTASLQPTLFVPWANLMNTQDRIFFVNGRTYNPGEWAPYGLRAVPGIRAMVRKQHDHE